MSQYVEREFSLISNNETNHPSTRVYDGNGGNNVATIMSFQGNSTDKIEIGKAEAGAGIKVENGFEAGFRANTAAAEINIEHVHAKVDLESIPV